MSSQVVKESLLSSPSMANLSAEGERHFIRLLLLKDDWGCFEATPEFVKGHCYMYHHNITSSQIITYHNELENNGDLRFWQNEKRIYGIFMSHEKHFNHYGVTEKGKQTRHRRKTPEPPKSIFSNEYKPLSKIITNHNTSLHIGSAPVPIPVLVPIPKNKKTNTLSAKADTRIKTLIDYYFQAHIKTQNGEKVHIDGGKDGMLFKDLLKTFTEQEIKDRIDWFMLFKDDFIDGTDLKAGAGRSVGVFKSQIAKYKKYEAWRDL